MIKLHDVNLRTDIPYLFAGSGHSDEKVTDVKPRTDDTVSFKLDGVECSATFDDVPTRQRFIRNAMVLGILEVA